MAKKINWAGVILIIFCVLGIGYVSSGFEESVEKTGVVRLVDADSQTLWIYGDDKRWYMPTVPLSSQFQNEDTVLFSGVLKRGDIAQTRADYLYIEITSIIRT